MVGKVPDMLVRKASYKERDVCFAISLVSYTCTLQTTTTEMNCIHPRNMMTSTAAHIIIWYL